MRYDKYMGADVVRSCLSPTIPADEEKRWPAACVGQEPDWTDEEAERRGWTLAFATDWASRVKGGGASFVKPRAFDAARFDGRGVYMRNAKSFWKFLSDSTSQTRGASTANLFVDSVYREINFVRTLRDGHVARRRVPLERYEIERGSNFQCCTEESIQYDQLATPFGVLNLTRATGLPLYASHPHFYDADPALLEAVVGLDPIRSKHNTYLDVEPRSGEVVSVAERLQFNMLLWNYDLPGILNNPPFLSDHEGVLRCAAQRANWTLPDRVDADGNLNANPLVVPIGYIAQGYDLSSQDMTQLALDLQAIDLIARLAFGLCFLAAAVAALLAYAAGPDPPPKATTLEDRRCCRRLTRKRAVSANIDDDHDDLLLLQERTSSTATPLAEPLL